MTRHQSSSAENHGADRGLQRLKGYERMAEEDARRSAELDVLIKRQVVHDVKRKAQQNGSQGGRNHLVKAKPSQRKDWICANCGCRNRLFVFCVECRTVRGT